MDDRRQMLACKNAALFAQFALGNISFMWDIKKWNVHVSTEYMKLCQSPSSFTNRDYESFDDQVAECMRNSDKTVFPVVK